MILILSKFIRILYCVPHYSKILSLWYISCAPVVFLLDHLKRYEYHLEFQLPNVQGLHGFEFLSPFA